MWYFCIYFHWTLSATLVCCTSNKDKHTYVKYNKKEKEYHTCNSQHAIKTFNIIRSINILMKFHTRYKSLNTKYNYWKVWYSVVAVLSKACTQVLSRVYQCIYSLSTYQSNECSRFKGLIVNNYNKIEKEDSLPSWCLYIYFH